jgi:hypothetical protein
VRVLLDGHAVGRRQPAARAAAPEAGPEAALPGAADGLPDPDRIARRRALKAAVLGLPQLAGRPPGGDDPVPGRVPRTVTGRVLDVSPHVLVIENGDAEERFALTADARAWRGDRTDPAAVKVGDHAVVRRHRSGREVADRIWANIGRVTGTITARDGETLVVDRGDGTGRQILVIAGRAAGRIQVRFPRLRPGYLVDIIGVRHDGYLEGLVPATSQPAYRADHVPSPALVSGHVPGSISGAAVWHEPDGEPDGLLGTCYPAIDRPHAAPLGRAGQRASAGCVSLPYLSAGSRLRVRNDCTARCLDLPVIGPAPAARLFCDRSVVCGPSPRGRIADLTLAGFVELGGELDEGNFNATIEIEG